MSNILLEWDKTGERFYETGVKRGVLFPMDSTTESGYGDGVAWNGLTAVNESPSGAEATALWADDIKYLNLYSREEFGATIEAYTYPDEFAECDGSAQLTAGVKLGQQPRKGFGFSYVTTIGNDVDGDALGYKIHLVYGCKASPSERSHATINDSPEAMTFSWTITTTPVEVSIPNVEEHFLPTSHIEIDSTDFNTTELKAKLTAFEEYLYGKAASGGQAAVPAAFPTPATVYSLLH